MSRPRLNPAALPASAARRRALGVTGALLAAPLALLSQTAAALDVPRGQVVLTLRGRVGKPNRGGEADFDMDMLAALPQHSITQATPWYAGPRKFTGPLLRDVLSAAVVSGRSVEAIAINDYRVTIPMEDLQNHAVILARLLDEQPMPLREKGPLFIVYPFATDPKLRSSLYYSRSAWQLRTLEVRP
ncbi:molybdopterin-dependent oxidoreductase [Roseateles sp.]|jgi:hypothetical protein|uniref:molybdopterin-dependent oxidoreductase n=1 Tax=Roseateles sp. TaxID=1971397 RepID=UPI0037C77F48